MDDSSLKPPLIFTRGDAPAAPALAWRNEDGTLEGAITQAVSANGMTEWEIQYRDNTRGGEWRVCNARPHRLKTAVHEAEHIYSIWLDYNERDRLIELRNEQALDVVSEEFEKVAEAVGAERIGPEDTRAPEQTEHPSLAGEPRPLTIGLATYDDYDGAYFTVQSIRLYHPEVLSDTEILVLDNNPTGPAAKLLKGLASSVEGYRYVPIADLKGTAVRDAIFKHTRSPYVLCLDSHVLMEPGSIRRLLDYFHSNPETNDLLQGPMLDDGLQGVATHFNPEWDGGMYGKWGADERGFDPEAPPFEIEMQGLGMFACRRDAWLGFNPRFRGFGGEEGYIHEKFRQAGARTLCLPFLRWLHRFGRPGGVPYPNYLEDRLRNYMLGWSELGLDLAPVEDHFMDLMEDRVFESVRRPILREIEALYAGAAGSGR